MASQPLVSICCITYNHRPFIRAALDGFLAQDVDFPIEILVHDDASTDGTADIIREYEARHAGVVRGIYQVENQYSRGVQPYIDIVMPQAAGRYIATCEGDDYWTDPNKLRMQVEYMEAHPSCMMTCTDFATRENGRITRKRSPTHAMGDRARTDGSEFVLRDLLRATPRSLTVVFRRSAFRHSDFASYRPTWDIHLYYHFLRQGHGYYFRKVTGVYNRHPGGVWSSLGASGQWYHAYLCARDLYRANRGEFTRTYMQLLAAKAIARPELPWRRALGIWGESLVHARRPIEAARSSRALLRRVMWGWEAKGMDGDRDGRRHS